MKKHKCFFFSNCITSPDHSSVFELRSCSAGTRTFLLLCLWRLSHDYSFYHYLSPENSDAIFLMTFEHYNAIQTSCEILQNNFCFLCRSHPLLWLQHLAIVFKKKKQNIFFFFKKTLPGNAKTVSCITRCWHFFHLWWNACLNFVAENLRFAAVLLTLQAR